MAETPQEHSESRSKTPGMGFSRRKGIQDIEFLTITASDAYTGRIVKRLVWVGVMIVVVLAIAIVLITPDQTDDVRALLHKCHPQFSLVTCLLLRTGMRFGQTAFNMPSYPAFHSSSGLIDITCVRIC